MPSDLIDLARTIATEAAELVAARRRDGASVVATKSSAIDIVTQADRDTETLIRDRLAAARPRDGFLGEEGGDARSESGITWVVDPIDGTVNYLYDIPRYCVSIAAVEGEPDPATWRALVGCVVNPSTGQVFTATDRAGAFENGRAIRASEVSDLTTALVATGFGYDSARRTRQGRAVAAMLGELRDIRRLGSAALDLCGVANGTLDGYFESGLQPWDHAAGALIAREAGASVTSWDGAPPLEALTLAANPPLAHALEARLAEFDYGL